MYQGTRHHIPRDAVKLFTLFALTPWFMEPGGSMSHSQRLSNNPYPEPNQQIPRIDSYLFKIHSNIFKALLPSSILGTNFSSNF